MNCRFVFSIFAAFFIACVVCGIANAGPITIGFDDLYTGPQGFGAMPSSYMGLNWSSNINNIGIVNAANYWIQPNGYSAGVVSASNVLYTANWNTLGTLTVTEQGGGAFDFVSAYFAAPWENNVLVEVKGLFGGAITNDVYFTLPSPYSPPTFVQFDFSNIDTLQIMTFAGSPGNRTGAEEYISIDNLVFSGLNPVPEAVPEPSLLILLGIGLGSVCLVGWRFKA